jgi:2-keto-4-pentenoate hydratase/2-oxohepta-3-ene-1,7-dioic acid hydratase in catechol pathway
MVIMKLVRFGERGSERPGLVDDEGAVRDLSSVVDDIAGATLLDDSLAELNDLDWRTLPLAPPECRLGACVSGTSKIVGVGLNYFDHAQESNMAAPAEPILFMKATSSICGPDDPVIMPRDATKLDWEVELGVVIGAPARYVEKDHALAHVAGYCILNDVSERAFQLERGGSWDKGKGCDTFAPLGPWLVTRDALGDPQGLAMHLSVNGQAMQSGSTSDMIFDVATLIAYISRFMTLNTGDIIATGTPAGVGMGAKPPRYLQVGDSMALTISGLGTQRQIVISDGDDMLQRA